MEGPGSRPIYSISAVARMVGVPVATLRTWEERYALVVPDRNASGHRLFSRTQVEQLRLVKMRMAEGLSAADAHRLLAERIGTGLPVAAPAGHSPRLLILLAEHDPDAAELQEYFLKTEGFEVDVALGDEAARRSFLDNSPSLVVVELLISGGSGSACAAFSNRTTTCRSSRSRCWNARTRLLKRELMRSCGSRWNRCSLCPRSGICWVERLPAQPPAGGLAWMTGC